MSLHSFRGCGSSRARLIITAALAALLAACTETDTSPPLAPEPAFARGGEGGNNGRILISSPREELTAEEIYSMNPDGTGLSRLTNSPGFDGVAVWSPDGKKIAFVSSRHEALGEIYVMNADGTGVTRLTNSVGFDNHPSWSKDGKRIVFISSRAAADPTLGSLADFEIFIMNADGTGIQRLTFNSAIDIDPDWSPDGKRIAFSSSRHDPGNTTAEIYVMNTDGSNVARLTYEGSAARFPAWAPGGKQLALNVGNDIYSMNADGSQLTLLAGGTYDIAPAWSDDGKRIAFSSERAGDWEAYVMNADGSAVSRITFSPGDDLVTGWRR